MSRGIGIDGLSVTAAIVDLARAAGFQLSDVLVRPPHHELMHRDVRSETLEPRFMQALVVLAAAYGTVGRNGLIARC